VNELQELAAQLLYLAATSDALPGLSADIDAPIETDGIAAWFDASTESGTTVRITLTAPRGT
jgi:hypothetical protein